MTSRANQPLQWTSSACVESLNRALCVLPRTRLATERQRYPPKLIMTQPSIAVLGAYRLEVTKPLIKQQFGELYNYEMSEDQLREALRHCIQQLHSVVLLEVLVENRDARFQRSDFTQQLNDVSSDSWQAPWAEAFLTPDGESLLVDRWDPPPDADTFRFAFFLHYFQPDRPLLSSYGQLQCPPIMEMPLRLMKLVPFIPVD